MFPPILLLHPDAADTLLSYRVARLPGAREKARSYSPPFDGAMFPWESAYSGQETCPTWAATGLREIHISGDIAFAVWQMWRSMLDDSGGWLDATAWPLLEGIATFWMSHIALDHPGANANAPLSIKNVIPPDEYADHANNSAYTNAVAILSLQSAAKVSTLLGKDASQRAQWLNAASRVIIPFNASGGWTPEYAGYAVGTKIKQADVILLGFPIEAPYINASVRANNLAYYATVTDAGGPAMTWGMFSVGYIELGSGFEALAASNFNRSFANAQPPFDVWTETPNGGTPNFLTGAGGFLQTAFNGYTGLRINDTHMTLLPTLPEATSTIALRGIAYRGARLNVRYDATSLTVEVQATPSTVPTFDAAHVRVYADACAAASRACRLPSPAMTEEDLVRLAMSPIMQPLAVRSQAGRVVLGGGVHVVMAQTLRVIDASGVSHVLSPGEPLTLSRQAISITSATA